MTRNMPQGMWLVVTLCFLGVGLQCSAQQKYPNIKAMLAKSYQTSVEYTAQPRNISEFSTEIHNRDDQTGYFEILISGVLNYIYYFGETNEEVSIINNICEVKPLDASVKKEGIIYHGSSSILYSLPDDKMVYKNEATVRGIKVSQFSYKDDKGNAYDVYFRTADWMADDNTTGQVPVRVTNSSANGFTMYDFYNFKPYKKRVGDMNLKTGLGCKGKKNPKGKALPTLPDQISFQYEVYNHKVVGGEPEDNLELNKIWFDATNKVAKVELNMRNVQGVTEIHDFNSGVMYVLSKDDSCQVRHVSESRFSASMREKGVVAMKSPAQLLALTGDYYYAGQTIIRGVACDIWESVQENVHRNNVTFDRLVTTFYFTTLKWFTVADGKEETFVPLYRTMAGATLDIYSAGVWAPDFQLAVSYFDFTEDKTYNQGFLLNMDISDCFISKTYFEMILMTDQNMTGHEAWKGYSQLSETLWEHMYTAAEISPLRIPRLQASLILCVGLLDDSTVHVVGVLLPEPAAIARFLPLKSDKSPYPGSNMKHLVRMSSQEECAQECYNDKGCLTFLYCDHECYTASTTFPLRWGEPIKVFGCQQYYKSAANISLPFKNSSAALEKIQAEVKMLEVKIDADGTNKVTYTAVKFNTDASPFNERSKAALYELALPKKALSLEAETTMKATPLFTSTEISSVQQCYRNCITETGTQCASFSYCPMTKECRLSSVYIMDDMDPRNVEVDTHCNVYIRSYMQLFDKFPGSVSRVGGDKSIPGVKTVAECAKACKHDELLRCRGFEYCPGSKNCILHSKHFLDLDPNDIVNKSDSCSHYALKFSADYTEGAKMELVDPNPRTIDLISLEDCAKACSTDPSETCQSFNFCPGDDGPDRKCVLNTLSVFDRGVTLKQSSTCLFYYQQDHVTNFIHHNKYLRSTTPVSGYTS
ncbi:unnamed protein product, partial [Ixodes hexagonus]